MLKDDLFKLMSLHGVTGHEELVSKAVYEMLVPLVDRAEIDGLGNVSGFRSSGRENAPKLMLSAHLDQVGMIVTEITDEGFAKVFSLGVDARTLLGTKLLILSESGPLHCYSAALPPHLQQNGDDTAPVRVEQLWLDLGMRGEDARKLVQIGDTVVFDVEPAALLNDRVTGAAIDDRAGVAAILSALRGMQGRELNCDIQVLFTTMEESNHEGCEAAVKRLRPDYMVVVDVCHASTARSQEFERVHSPGCGAVIAFGMNSTPTFAAKIEEVAGKHSIPYEREGLPGRSFTDAWAAQTANEGIAVAVVSMPIRHMHSAAEVLALSDAEAVSNLLKELCLDFGGVPNE